MKKINYLILLFTVLFAGVISAQTYTISGKVTSAATGEALVGANVYLQNTTTGAATDVDGKYSISTAAGQYTVVASFIGFEKQSAEINLTNNMELNFTLKDYQFQLNVTVLADRAKERETPVAFSNIDKKEIEQQLGSKDIPLVLNTTPSVYATDNGGGAGDARVNIRGFDQKNVAIMINGVPVNDMENGWVYWSNWDGVGDASESIQVQRGLSAVNLATPSIGGTMNVITDPTAAKSGTSFKQEFGTGNFYKSTLIANTGLIDNKWAANMAIVRKFGDGVIDKTWTDAWAYYFGVSYNVNDKNRIEFYLLGAPQRHGQNSYKQNIAAYSHELASEQGYSQAALDKYPEAGRKYNETWGKVSPDYKGKQWAAGFMPSGEKKNRYDASFINERENYFHKPIGNLNWYSQLSNKVSLYTTLYWSGGHGGGTGTFGSIKYDTQGLPSRVPNWDATIANNRTGTDADGKIAAKGILRNSVNNQWTYGLISKAYIKVSESFKASFGIDWRTAEIDHYREVRDLLGGHYYQRFDSDFWGPNGKKLVLGDKFNYYNTNTVDWYGAYAQGEYTQDKLTAYGTVGWSMIGYTFTDHFAKDAATGGKVFTEADFIHGYQFKGGASYRLSSDLSVFANAGYVSKVPIFDAVIDDGDGSKSADPQNEKFISFEAGVNLRALDGKLDLTGNIYYTSWKDRSNSRNVTNLDGTEGLVFLTGLDARHMGVEMEAAYQPIRELRFDLAASYGNWIYTDDVAGTYKDYTNGNEVTKTFNYYIKDLKVGDQPQTSISFTTSVYPIEGMYISGTVRYYQDFYAQYDPFGRQDITDRAQSWEIPSYSVVDMHFAYDLPLNLNGLDIQLFGHVFNVLDELFITDAVDNSSFNAYTANGKTHSADDAEVYVSLPRTVNFGARLAF